MGCGFDTAKSEKNGTYTLSKKLNGKYGLMMKTLSEHNKQKHELNLNHNPMYDFAKPVKAGVACDKCGTEMIIPNPYVVLASLPPQQTVQCPSCQIICYMVK